MKTSVSASVPFIAIPAVGSSAAYSLDPLNRAQVVSLIRKASAWFKLSAQAWEEGNNSGSNAIVVKCEKESQRCATNGESLLSPLGIKCDWPGLHPSFQISGHHEYDTRCAVLVALGHERNWILPDAI